MSGISGERRWRHVGRCIEGELFEIDGVNVWSHEWHRVPGVTAEGRDPLYGEEYQFAVYEIRAGAKAIRFGAGEQSVNVYGFCLLEPEPRKTQP